MSKHLVIVQDTSYMPLHSFLRVSWSLSHVYNVNCALIDLSMTYLQIDSLGDVTCQRVKVRPWRWSSCTDGKCLNQWSSGPDELLTRSTGRSSKQLWVNQLQMWEETLECSIRRFCTGKFSFNILIYWAEMMMFYCWIHNFKNKVIIFLRRISLIGLTSVILEISLNTLKMLG